MSWLDTIKIGDDLKNCPDCDREYEVLDEFWAQKEQPPTMGADWLDEMFSDEYYIALRCPQCLETRHLRIKSLTQSQYLTAQEANMPETG